MSEAVVVNQSGSTPVQVTLSEPSSLPAEFSGLVTAVSVAVTLTPVNNEVNQVLLPEIAKKIVASAQNAISGRLHAVTSTAITPDTPFQLAGQKSVSDFLLFGAQTFDKVHNHNQSFSLEPLLNNTSFVLPLTDAQATGWSSVTVWGSGDYHKISGGDDLSWDGSVINVHLGSDIKIAQSVLTGFSASWSQGVLDYDDSLNQQNGEYTLDLYGVHPYVSLSVTSWLNVWLIGGYGQGEITIDSETDNKQSSDMVVFSGTGGFSLSIPGIRSLKLKGSSSAIRQDIEGNDELIASLTTDSSQQRVALEVSPEFISTGRRFIPSVEVGARYDSGDGETGYGVEVGGGILYTLSSFTFSANGRWLATHSGNLEEWGAGGLIRLQPGAQGQGFWFTLSPTVGQTQERTQQLWDANHLSDINVSSDRGVSLGTELGYGFVVSDGIAEPYGSMNFSNMGSTKYRIGARFAGGTTTASLEVGREERLSIPIEHSVKLEAKRSF